MGSNSRTFAKDMWKTIMFSDEKMFNLDKLNSLSYYWHSLTAEKRVEIPCNLGDGFVTVQNVIYWFKTSQFAFLFRRKKEKPYCKSLEQYLVPFNGFLLENNHYINFQQDNSFISFSEITHNLLRFKFIRSMTWSTRLPDHISIENIWGCLAMEVYNNEHPYNSVAELK